MNQDEEKARKELDGGSTRVRERLGDVHVAFDAVVDAGPEDDLRDQLEKVRNP